MVSDPGRAYRHLSHGRLSSKNSAMWEKQYLKTVQVFSILYSKKCVPFCCKECDRVKCHCPGRCLRLCSPGFIRMVVEPSGLAGDKCVTLPAYVLVLSIYPLFLLCVFVCEPTWVHMRHMYAEARRSHKRPSDPLELELQMIVSLPASSGNWTWILWKGSKSSYLLILSCPLEKLYMLRQGV